MRPGGTFNSVQFTPAGHAHEDPTADEAQLDKGRNDELEPLSHEELSEKYGVGFAILCRMGYSGKGFKPGSLHAPLAARANVGRQGLAEATEAGEVAAPGQGPDSELSEAVDLTLLLSQTLRSMREAGDDEEASELQHLATFCNLQGEALEALEPRPKRKRKAAQPDRVGDAADESAMRCILESFRDQDFPVEMQEQARHLKWNKRWAAALGNFHEFVARHEAELRVIACPGGVSLLLPWQRQPGPTEQRLEQSCLQLCHAHRGKSQAGRKWKHMTKTLQAIFKGRQRGQKPDNLDRDKGQNPSDVTEALQPNTGHAAASTSCLDEASDAPRLQGLSIHGKVLTARRKPWARPM